MKKKFLALSILLSLTAGCLAMEPIEVREGIYGKGVPVITQSFASLKIRPGDTWKVYLKASDPDGDMRYIVSVIEQPGIGIYPLSYTRIAEGNRKDLSGYLYLTTIDVQGLNLVNLSLTVQIQDRAGHYSKPVSFPLSFNHRYRQELPPVDVFPEKNLGPILIRLRTLGDGTGNGIIH
jgi:hypothetical protein